MTIYAHWSFETLLDQFAPATFPGMLPLFPAPGGTIIAAGASAPSSGVWLPIDVPMACPNYRNEGHVGAGVRIPTERTDVPALPAEYGAPATPARRHYEFKEVPTRWQLVWEDHRYTSGDLPVEEAEYLDESTAFPNAEATPVAPFPFRGGS
jgi:hypothetical protein